MNKINVMHVYDSRHIYCVLVSSEHIFTLCVSVKLFKSIFCNVKPFKWINQSLLIYYFINTKLKLIWWDLPFFMPIEIKVCLQASISINLVECLYFGLYIDMMLVAITCFPVHIEDIWTSASMLLPLK
jgi:hypothetical protein